MVKAIIEISPEANRVLNIVKAREELKTKSGAIEWLAKHHAKTHEGMEIATRKDLQLHHRRALYG